MEIFLKNLVTNIKNIKIDKIHKHHCLGTAHQLLIKKIQCYKSCTTQAIIAITHYSFDELKILPDDYESKICSKKAIKSWIKKFEKSSRNWFKLIRALVALHIGWRIIALVPIKWSTN